MTVTRNRAARGAIIGQLAKAFGWGGIIGPRGWLRRRDRGAMAVLIAAVVAPALIGVGVLAIGQGYYTYRKVILQQAVQAAALAAGNNLATYYSTGSTATIVAAAQTFAVANMPTAKYGTVIQPANVVVGSWNGTAFTSGGTSPNAVKVTGLSTAANGNPIGLFLGSWFGRPTVDYSTTVIAGNGTGGGVGSGQAFNTVVINDMSQSFQSEIANQVAADLAMLNCVKGTTGTSSQFGITFVNGHAYTYQALEAASANYTALQTAINAIVQCTAPQDPNCSTGSNIASGMYSAISQLSGLSSTSKKNIVIITDGVPDAHSGTTYSAADGVTCTTNCTDALMQAGAQTQSTRAKTAGISISTIYYSGDTSQQDVSTYSNYLAGLVTGSGIALVAPTSAQINAAFAAFCSTIPSAVKTVSQ
jgi:Flp pilus assembly protein TadG